MIYELVVVLPGDFQFRIRGLYALPAASRSRLGIYHVPLGFLSLGDRTGVDLATVPIGVGVGIYFRGRTRLSYRLAGPGDSGSDLAGTGLAPLAEPT